MPRRPRTLVPGGIYHVTARGSRGGEIFVDLPVDCTRFLATVAEVVERLGWRCHGYCLIPNHYHLLVETPNADLPVGMHRLNGLYAQWFNRRYAGRGHVFQARFHDVLIESNSHLLEVSRYMPLNPVRAALCADPGQWPWSSFRVIAGVVEPESFLTVDWILSQFGAEPSRARASFRAFVDDGLRHPPALKLVA